MKIKLFSNKFQSSINFKYKNQRVFKMYKLCVLFFMYVFELRSEISRVLIGLGKQACECVCCVSPRFDFCLRSSPNLRAKPAMTASSHINKANRCTRELIYLG